MQGDWWSAGGEAPKFWLEKCANAVQLSVVSPPMLSASVLRLPLALMRLNSEIGSVHFASLAASRSRNRLFFAEDCYVGESDGIFSERLEDIILERDTFAHNLNDIKVRLQKAGHDPCAGEIEKDALIENVGVFQAKMILPRVKRNSFQVFIEHCAVSPAVKKQKELLVCLSSSDARPLGIPLLILKGIAKRKGLKTSERDLFQEIPSRQWDRTGSLVSTQRIVQNRIRFL